MKWNIRLGERTDAISADLLGLLGFSSPYSNDDTVTARDETHGRIGLLALAEAYGAGLIGDAAALYAIRLREERKQHNTYELAMRKTIAEIELKAAEEHRAAEGMALARQKRADK